MTLQRQQLTVEAFEHFTELPENAERLFEFVGGEIVEVPSNPYSSYIASRINRRVATFVEDNDLGFVTGEAGGYRVFGERYAPDVAFISKARQPELPHEGYNPNPPDLAVEVVSPTDSEKRLSIKVGNYLAAETTVWVVYPLDKEVVVYKPGQPPQIVTDVLDGGEVLPGFTLALKDVFGE